jgi:HK97 gp10 family phage protein
VSRSFRVNFSVPELKQAMDNISAYDGRATGKIENAVSRATKNISKGARQRVPVASGELKKSIRSRFDKKSVTGYVSAKQYYSHMIEFGTKPHTIGNGQHPGTAARPYMRPAFEAEKPNLIRDIENAVKP